MDKNQSLEEYGEVIESEFIKLKKDKTIYEKYLEFIVYLVPDISKNKNSTIAKITNKIYEYLSPSITYAPTFTVSPSPTAPSTSSQYPIDANIVYSILIFIGMLIFVFIVIKYKAILGLFSKKSSNSMLLSSDSSSELSSSE